MWMDLYKVKEYITLYMYVVMDTCGWVSTLNTIYYHTYNYQMTARLCHIWQTPKVDMAPSNGMALCSLADSSWGPPQLLSTDEHKAVPSPGAASCIHHCCHHITSYSNYSNQEMYSPATESLSGIESMLTSFEMILFCLALLLGDWPKIVKFLHHLNVPLQVDKELVVRTLINQVAREVWSILCE
jgi:hypothetical protein